MGERVADGEVSLGSDGHRHEDGGRQHDVLRRVEQPGEGVRVQATGVNLGGKREKECLSIAYWRERWNPYLVKGKEETLNDM